MIRIIDKIIAGAIGHPTALPKLTEGFSHHPKIQRVLTSMIQALGSSCNTLLRLSDAPGLQSRDCFSICRSIVELSVNICYICAEGEVAADRAEKHAHQKSFRDLDRKSSVGDQTIKLQFSEKDKLRLPAEVMEIIDEFTSRSGREKGWTDLSIDARCEKVGEIFGDNVLTPLHWARFAVYRHSSEILHGTFFSTVFFMGLTDSTGGPSSLDEWIDKIAGQHLMIIMATVLSLIAVTRTIDAIFGAKELVIQSECYLDDLKTAPFFSDTKPK